MPSILIPDAAPGNDPHPPTLTPPSPTWQGLCHALHPHRPVQGFPPQADRRPGVGRQVAALEAVAVGVEYETAAVVALWWEGWREGGGVGVMGWGVRRWVGGVGGGVFSYAEPALGHAFRHPKPQT